MSSCEKSNFNIKAVVNNPSQNPFESIIIGNCLSCQGLVRVPATARASSKVRCPHCSNSYLLSQILDQAVPELELVDEPSDTPGVPRVDQILENPEGDEPQKFVVPPQLSKGAHRSRRRRHADATSTERSGSGNFRGKQR